MIKVANKKYTLYEDNSIVSRCHKLSNRLNRFLGGYYPDYKFSKNVPDEPHFRFKTEQLPRIIEILRGQV